MILTTDSKGETNYHSLRKFQQSASYIFTNYCLEIRDRIRGVTYIAQRESKDDITVQDMNDIIAYFKDNLSADAPVLPNDLDSVLTTNNEPYTRKEIQKLIQRLVPYSQTLKGTSMHIQQERKKLLSMLSSPIVTSSGKDWRWFLTYAPADVYDNRLFEILIETLIDEQLGTEDEKSTTQTLSEYLLKSGRYGPKHQIHTRKHLNKEDRILLLRRHPALAARLFDLKQKCIWKCILEGNDAPLGKISDFWRRIEV
jgi:hypothetical protein